LEQNGIQTPIDSEWADLRFLPEKPQGLVEKIKVSFELYPCQIIFIHRDSDREPIGNRKNEIEDAVAEAFGENPPIFVCVIPVRMQEAWLLFDQSAIRWAAGNPRGSIRLNLPAISCIERIADPKNLLNSLLKDASELHGRHLRRLNFSHSASQVSQNIVDFSPLRRLSAFQLLENDVRQVVNRINSD
jgi:hypothetical protein